MEDCLICNRINMIKEGINKYFVAELETGYVVIGDHQYFEGYTLYICKVHKNELHELDSDYKQKFLDEMSKVSEAVYRAFKPDKLNYELLGNGDSHMHWHIFPRRLTETNPKFPVWWTPKDTMYSESVKPSNDALEELKNKLLVELNKVV
ncbi:HIT family protein [Paenibacillus sp. GP183]|jgi:diadenosine tetraphosphate (Ap4A) HIT family hydrolase|uniref:HIT family protein n=1 Tax=Paenibacillus sp. GP183 TaxID=1882751 RepID=UPI000896F3DA|nr:HIT family protein [Paenibacillus sp. GP183]SED09848.1 Diadenosine tetraphosphate (Ap4A) hydrolase [Paenibacillus sp. GP183]